MRETEAVVRSALFLVGQRCSVDSDSLGRNVLAIILPSIFWYLGQIIV